MGKCLIGSAEVELVGRGGRQLDKNSRRSTLELSRLACHSVISLVCLSVFVLLFSPGSCLKQIQVSMIATGDGCCSCSTQR